MGSWDSTSEEVCTCGQPRPAARNLLDNLFCRSSFPPSGSNGPIVHAPDGCV